MARSGLRGLYRVSACTCSNMSILSIVIVLPLLCLLKITNVHDVGFWRQSSPESIDTALLWHINTGCKGLIFADS